jgi:integrase
MSVARPQPQLAAAALRAYAQLVPSIRSSPISQRAAMNAASRLIRQVPEALWSHPTCAEYLEDLDPEERCFLNFLMLWGYVRPGYAFLLAHKFQSLVNYTRLSPHAGALDRLEAGARELQFGRRHIGSMIPQVILRVLIQTGKTLEALDPSDLADFRAAVQEHEEREHRRHKHFSVSLHAVENLLYHLGIFQRVATHASAGDGSWEHQLNRVRTPELREVVRRYLRQLAAVLKPGTVAGYANTLCQFSAFVEALDPGLSSFGQLRRERHLEPWLVEVSHRPLSASHRRGLVMEVKRFLDDLEEWGWEQAPRRRLLFAQDLPKLSSCLPRYLPHEQDEALCRAFLTLEDPFKRCGLLILRHTGLRISELLALELDCVHEVPGKGAWLKVPLGKLRTERMVPLAPGTLDLVDEAIQHRGRQRPLPDPATGRLVDYLFVRRGKRVSCYFMRHGLDLAVQRAGLPSPITPHQLRHTYATSLVNAGVSLPVLMHLLGHQSMDMSLRYGRLFDATVRAEYEAALETFKQKYSPTMLAQAAQPPVDSAWLASRGHKERLVHGRCLRPTATGCCPHANSCYLCSYFQPDPLARRCMREQLKQLRLVLKDAAARGLEPEVQRQQACIVALEAILRRPDFQDGRTKRPAATEDHPSDLPAPAACGPSEHLPGGAPVRGIS